MAWHGTLDRHGTSVVASLCFYVFTPALTFTTLAAAMSLDSIRHLWPLLVNMSVSSIIGLATGRATAWALGVPTQFRNLVVVAIAFGNVGNLPLVFVGALCGDPNAIFQKALGSNCERLGIAYTAFDICVATLFQFTLALYLLKPRKEGLVDRPSSDGGNETGAGERLEDELQQEENELQRSGGWQDIHRNRGGTASGDTVTITLPPREDTGLLFEGQGASVGSEMSLGSMHMHKLPTVSDLIAARDGTALPTVPPSPPTPSSPNHDSYSVVQIQEIEMMRASSPSAPSPPSRLVNEIFGDDDAADLETLLPSRRLPPEYHHNMGTTTNIESPSFLPTSSKSTRILIPTTTQHSRHSTEQRKNLFQLMQYLCSSPKACFPLLIKWLKSIDWWAAFPLPTQAAFAGVLIGCIPMLKGLLYGPAPPLRPLAEALELLGQGLIPGAIPLLGAVLYRGPGRSKLPRKVTTGVVLTRLVLQPALLTGLVVVALHFKLFTSPDPMFLLSLLLANATPTAINMQTLTVLYNFGAEEMSQMLFFQYLFALITLPGYIGIFLKIIQAYGV